MKVVTDLFFKYPSDKFIIDLDMNYVQGNIVDRIAKFKKSKNPLYLTEAIKFAEMGYKLKTNNFVLIERSLGALDIFADLNDLSISERSVIECAIFQNWLGVVVKVRSLIEEVRNKK